MSGEAHWLAVRDAGDVGSVGARHRQLSGERMSR